MMPEKGQPSPGARAKETNLISSCTFPPMDVSDICRRLMFRALLLAYWFPMGDRLARATLCRIHALLSLPCIQRPLMLIDQHIVATTLATTVYRKSN